MNACTRQRGHRDSGAKAPQAPAALAVFAGLVLAGGPRAEAQCNTSQVYATINPTVAGQPVPPGACVVAGQALTYRVTLDVPEPAWPLIYCSVVGGDLGLTLPDCSPAAPFVPMAGHPGEPSVAQIDAGCSWVMYAPVEYVVDPADIVDGYLTARVDYGSTAERPEQENGTFLSAEPSQTANAAAVTATRACVPAIGLAAEANPPTLCSEAAVEVEYTYSVFDLTGEASLSFAEVEVVDELWGPAAYAGGDADGDGRLDADETWQYTIAAVLSGPTTSVATATALAVPFNGTPVTGYVPSATATVAVGPCPPASCAGDVDGDGMVDFADLVAVLGGWGPCPGECDAPCPGDVDDDCTVGPEDLIALLTAWGACP